jgi:hypothetical protein
MSLVTGGCTVEAVNTTTCPYKCTFCQDEVGMPWYYPCYARRHVDDYCFTVAPIVFNLTFRCEHSLARCPRNAIALTPFCAPFSVFSMSAALMTFYYAVKTSYKLCNTSVLKYDVAGLGLSNEAPVAPVPESFIQMEMAIYLQRSKEEV